MSRDCRSVNVEPSLTMNCIVSTFVVSTLGSYTSDRTPSATVNQTREVVLRAVPTQSLRARSKCDSAPGAPGAGAACAGAAANAASANAATPVLHIPISPPSDEGRIMALRNVGAIGSGDDARLAAPRPLRAAHRGARPGQRAFA